VPRTGGAWPRSLKLIGGAADSNGEGPNGLFGAPVSSGERERYLRQSPSELPEPEWGTRKSVLLLFLKSAGSIRIRREFSRASDRCTIRVRETG